MPSKASRIAARGGGVGRDHGAAHRYCFATTYDRHEVARTAVTVRATTGHVVMARNDVIRAGGQVTQWLPAINGFVAQVPVTSVAGLRKAPGIASVTVQGPLIRE